MCDDGVSCGTIFVLVHDGFRHAFHRNTYLEIVHAARLLRQVSVPALPLALMHNERILTDRQLRWLQSKPIYSLWDRHVTFEMHPAIKPYYAMWAKELGAGSPNVRGWQSISYWKASALLQSPFNRTLFLDNDVYVLQPSLVNDLLGSTLRNADVAIPVNTARGTGFWASAPLPSLCIALVAFNSNAATRDFFVGAARRLATHAHLGAGYAGVEQRDQEMLWFEWRATPAFRMLPLPEEYYCPDVELELNGSVPQAWWQLNWGTLDDATLGRLPCKSVHGHARYFYRQLAPTVVTTTMYMPRRRRSGDKIGKVVLYSPENGSSPLQYNDLYKSKRLGHDRIKGNVPLRRFFDPWKSVAELANCPQGQRGAPCLQRALASANVSYVLPAPASLP